MIAGRLSEEDIIGLTAKTIYRFVGSNPVYRKFLPYYGRRRSKKKRGQSTPRPSWGKDISERSVGCENRTHLGHWERDCMLGESRRDNLLVHVDRKSRFSRLSPIRRVSSSLVRRETMNFLKLEGMKARSMTNDNGTEFKGRKSLPIPVYFCHPYTPQERGTVENTIGVMRRFYPKGSSLREMDIASMENWLNYRPVKVLNFRTPYEVYHKCRIRLLC